MFYTFKATYYNDIDNKEEKLKGFTIGESYHDAMEQLIKFYGELELMSVTLAPFTSSNLIEFREEDFDIYKLARKAAEKNVMW